MHKMTIAKYMCCIWRPRPPRAGVEERQDSETFAVQTGDPLTKPIGRSRDQKSQQEAVKRMLTDFDKWKPLEEPSTKRTRREAPEPVIEQLPSPFTTAEEQVSIGNRRTWLDPPRTEVLMADMPRIDATRTDTPRGSPCSTSLGRTRYAVHGSHEDSGLDLTVCS